ncbi:AAA family ATPase [uncultured Parabacteroides sp.]|uniref:ATP-binding protein n=1 Tax=uncultured Parabacteroides sp. TaxID=512312 RepID=UPI0025F63103|nr:AAA family ATPase [uncultured Parabacteroides sp.]
MKYLRRTIDAELKKWAEAESRKPLLLRGARQVGKSSAVRNLARSFTYFLEVNFESDREVHTFFEGNLDPAAICEKLSLYYNIPVRPGETLLFFDEIQVCLPAISSLRFFYEKYGELHLVAAGSLLEFALSDLRSFAVGRVRSLFMYPFSFDEFLWAMGEERLADAKNKADYEHPLAEPFHNKLNDYLKKFLILGGMPEVVSEYASNGDMLECMRILDDIKVAFRADFAKYKEKVPTLRIQEVFDSAAEQAGGKFVYARASSDSSYRQVREAVELLVMAGLLIPVYRSPGNGIPLGAGSDLSQFKLLVMDMGLFQRMLGLAIPALLVSEDWEVVNKGALAELFAGLELVKNAGPYTQAQLFYWAREAKGSNAEVDYLVQQSDRICPIEIKSGVKGSMRSLYVYLEEKGLDYGIRSSLENFSSYDKIRVCPLYALGKKMFT